MQYFSFAKALKTPRISARSHAVSRDIDYQVHISGADKKVQKLLMQFAI